MYAFVSHDVATLGVFRGADGENDIDAVTQRK